jgi:hypothetical protein
LFLKDIAVKDMTVEIRASKYVRAPTITTPSHGLDLGVGEAVMLVDADYDTAAGGGQEDHVGAALWRSCMLNGGTCRRCTICELEVKLGYRPNGKIQRLLAPISQGRTR